MDLKIETATIKVLDELYELEEACFDQEAFSKRQIGYLLTDYNTVALMAKVEGSIVGFIIAQVEVEENTEFGHIITLNIAPKYRHQKIATNLLKEIEDILKLKGITESRLEVREDNHVAIKLYKTLCYRTMGKLERYYGTKHGIYLKKIL
jgi:[ribosomal protein S18]-alanine N-acetyltransferase